MSELVDTTVAPYRTVVLVPHPSGLSQLPSLTLREGDKLRVTMEEAMALYQDQRVLHPVSGKPFFEARRERERGIVTITDAHGRPSQGGWDPMTEYPTETPPVDDRPPPPRHPSRGG